MPFKVGNSQTEGLYAKNLAYYLVINDYSDMTFYADVMTKRGIQGRAEAVYVVTPFAQGNINGSYIQRMGHPAPPLQRFRPRTAPTASSSTPIRRPAGPDVGRDLHP